MKYTTKQSEKQRTMKVHCSSNQTHAESCQIVEKNLTFKLTLLIPSSINNNLHSINLFLSHL